MIIKFNFSNGMWKKNPFLYNTFWFNLLKLILKVTEIVGAAVKQRSINLQWSR